MNSTTLYAFCVVTLVVGSVNVQGQSSKSVQNAGPVSWRSIEARTTAPDFVLLRRVVDVAQHGPASIQIATLRDTNSFGDTQEHEVWLARYTGISVSSVDRANSAILTMNVAFDASTQRVICAFTDSSTTNWVQGTLAPIDVEVRAAESGWVVETVSNGPLKSTLKDVLEATWKRFGVDPSKAGQIVIRPRFVTNRFPVEESTGDQRFPASNVWLVEVLGTPTVQRKFGGEVHYLTTIVAQFRDGDLAMFPGMILP